MTIEGIRNPEALRDFLYAKMRGARDDHEPSVAGAAVAAGGTSPQDEALVLLHEIRDELRALRHKTGGH
jgi:putative membrane protein